MPAFYFSSTDREYSHQRRVPVAISDSTGDFGESLVSPILTKLHE